MQGKTSHKHAEPGGRQGIQLEAPLRMTLERAIEYIDIDEYVEATPKSLRLRKRILDATARKRAPQLPLSSIPGGGRGDCLNRLSVVTDSPEAVRMNRPTKDKKRRLRNDFRATQYFMKRCIEILR